jgi:arsenite methyltransferase
MNLPPDFADAAYDELSFWGSRFGALLFEYLPIRANVRGLDVACGTGFPLFELAHVHGPGSHFTGVDIWPEAIARARRKLAFYGLANVELVECDASSMPFDDRTFDLVTSNIGINNFEDPPRVLRECFRVMKPGATIAVTTNLTGHFRELYAIFREEIGADLRPALDEQEAHRGTRAEIERMLADAAFRVTQIAEREFFIPFATGTAMLRHSLVQFFMDGWKSVTDDPRVWARIEERLNAASPLRMTVPMLYAEAVRS